ncbi:hypothetical protein ACFY5A_04490 [Microbacterium sp. NPDC012755]|uniref:hypothetical protein n=1 Tax=Microbacterium sp. NPDC012755 TaxID=3364184 RepID=UPI0036A167BF
MEIDHGGAICVDPESLREVAARLAALATDIDGARSSIMRAHRIIVDAPGAGEQVDTVALWASGERAEELRSECDSAVIGIRLMADVYEYVELQAEADALALAHDAGADVLRRRMERLADGDARIPDMATLLVQGWKDERFRGLDSQFNLGGLLAPLFLGAGAVGATGLGVIPAGSRLTGTADPVSVTPVRTSSPSGAPAGAADALRRMPSAAGAQVAVEKYTMPGGEARYVTYLSGTQNAWPQSLLGGKEPWDMKSNRELYTGRRSSSYQATLDALAAAGAKPGDEVDVVAHSQSGMIAAHLAMESDYDVKVQITAGSPVEPALDDDQTIVQFRHTDDLVSSLAGGGSPGGTGSADSVTVTREGDPRDGIQDAGLETHQLRTYIETAEMADASGDPRIEALGEFWADLDEAVEVERTEYRATRD